MVTEASKPSIGDATFKRKFRFYAGIVCLLLMFYAPFYAFVIGIPAIGYVCFAGCIAFAVLTQLANRISANALTHASAAMGTALIVGTTCFSGGLYSPSFYWLAATPVLVGMLRGARTAIAWGIANLSLSLAIWVMQSHLPTPFPALPPSSFEYTAMASVAGLVLLLSSFVYMHFVAVATREAALRQAQTEASTLLRIVTHDIATPLTVIRTYAQILKTNLAKTGQELPQMQQPIDRMTAAVERIANVLSDVRALQRLRAGNLPPPKALVDMSRLVRSAEPLHEVRLAQKQLNLEIEAPPEGAAVVRADASLLATQVIDNLLSNAIKFSPHGGAIHIAVKVDGDDVSVTVRDGGIGIPADIRRKLFDPEAHVTRAGTDGEPGTGFGLTLVKSYVEFIGGRVELESRTADEEPETHGTEVRVTLKKSA